MTSQEYQLQRLNKDEPIQYYDIRTQAGGASFEVDIDGKWAMRSQVEPVLEENYQLHNLNSLYQDQIGLSAISLEKKNAEIEALQHVLSRQNLYLSHIAAAFLHNEIDDGDGFHSKITVLADLYRDESDDFVEDALVAIHG
ncbi:hypothetical protein KAR91_72755 [Candidatus Pacearchaeota archaeon]|nr:hypothetical protein [Candidatus Pacearchaeota archaeon]